MAGILCRPTILVGPASRKLGIMSFVMLCSVFSSGGGGATLAEQPFELFEAPLGAERMVAGAVSIEVALLWQDRSRMGIVPFKKAPCTRRRKSR